jgi:hypothetical protein
MTNDEIKALVDLYAEALVWESGPSKGNTLLLEKMVRDVETTVRQRAHRLVQEIAIQVAELNRPRTGP